MLFSYTYITHDMEKMQDYMDYIFYEVWYKAIYTPGTFSLELFNAKPELKEIMEDFFYGDTEGGDLFYKSIEEIFYLFQKIDPARVNQLKSWYEANNDIEALCKNDSSKVPASYKDLDIVDQRLSEKIKKLFKNLYGSKIIGLKAITEKIGTINSHYHDFMKVNTTGVCPCCGLHSLKGNDHNKREAYDHYLPKGKYPFNSINFKNLVPICNECNSSYKLEKDPINGKEGRRKAFYLYSKEVVTIDISIQLNLMRKDEIRPDNIDISFQADGYEEEIETWKDIYGIEERYKAECSAENSGLDWLEQITDDLNNYDGTDKAITKDEYLEIERKAKMRKPLAEKRFLKLPFLEACDEIGLLD